VLTVFRREASELAKQIGRVGHSYDASGERREQDDAEKRGGRVLRATGGTLMRHGSADCMPS
jgi:hypothetical protein